MNFLGVKLPPLQQVAFGTVGFLAPQFLEAQISKFMPASLIGNTLARYAVKVLAVLGVSWGVKAALGREAGKMALIGGGVYVLTGGLREFAPQLLPAGVGAYVPAGVGAYTSFRRGGLSGGVMIPAVTAGGGGLPAYAAPRAVSARFRRF